MKSEIEEFRKLNGNITYTTKELIGALHTKTDRIESKLDGKLGKSTFWKIYGGSIVLLGIIISLLANLRR